MEKFGEKPTEYRLVRDKRTSRLVNPEDHPQNLEATAFTEGPDFDGKTGNPLEVTAFEGGPDFVSPEDVGGMLLEAEPSEALSLPPVEDNAAGFLHQELAVAGKLELVARVPENDRRHVKSIPAQDLADLALASYLETPGVSSRLWNTVKFDDPRFLELRRQAQEIAGRVANDQVSRNLYVPKALRQMQLLIAQAATAILRGGVK